MNAQIFTSHCPRVTKHIIHVGEQPSRRTPCASPGPQLALKVFVFVDISALAQRGNPLQRPPAPERYPRITINQHPRNQSPSVTLPAVFLPHSRSRCQLFLSTYSHHHPLQSGALLTAAAAAPVVALRCLPVECEAAGCFLADGWVALARIVAGEFALLFSHREWGFGKWY